MEHREIQVAAGSGQKSEVRDQTSEGSSVQLSSSFASCAFGVIRSLRFAVIGHEAKGRLPDLPLTAYCSLLTV